MIPANRPCDAVDRMRLQVGKQPHRLAMMVAADPRRAAVPSSLPPHLREVCALLATGLLRLRGRTAADLARDALQARDRGEVSLHSSGQQSGHAGPIRRPA
jgi:hypothetical protein